MKILAPLDVTGNAIQNVPTPVANGDAANKQYVDTKAPTTTGPTGYVASFIKTNGNLGPFNTSTATGIQTLANVVVGRYYAINVLLPLNTDAAGLFTFSVNDGTVSQQVASMPASTALAFSVATGTLLYTPASTGVKTFRVDITRQSGAGTVTFMGGASYQLQLVVSDLGGAPPVGTGLGLVASQVLTTSQTGNVSPLVDSLTVSFTPVVGAAYRMSVLSPFSKTDPTGYWATQLLVNGSGQQTASIPAAASGELSGSFLYLPPTAASITLGVQHTMYGGTNNLTLPGSATAPRQLWVERIG